MPSDVTAKLQACQCLIFTVIKQQQITLESAPNLTESELIHFLRVRNFWIAKWLNDLWNDWYMNYMHKFN